MIGAEGMDLQGFRGLFAGDVLLYGMGGGAPCGPPAETDRCRFAELPAGLLDGPLRHFPKAAM